MTTIIIGKSKESYKSITCMGHSGRKRIFFEKDLVCASISVLVLNTINGLDEFTDTTMELVTNEETGFIRVVFSELLSESATVLIQTMIMGLEQISQQYGTKYCNIEFEEV